MFTVRGILFQKESTEGVAAGQTTAMDYENEAFRTEKDDTNGKTGEKLWNWTEKYP